MERITYEITCEVRYFQTFGIGFKLVIAQGSIGKRQPVVFLFLEEQYISYILVLFQILSLFPVSSIVVLRRRSSSKFFRVLLASVTFLATALAATAGNPKAERSVNIGISGTMPTGNAIKE